MPSAILFGAGASFGSQPRDVPPLGEGLFGALQVFAPDLWGRIAEPNASIFRGDFEAGMTALSSANPHALPPLQRAMAAYFFNFTPTTDSLYVQLGHRIKARSWRGSLVTLNYERLLTMSLFYVGLQPNVAMGSSTAAQIELCLPHGCCDLFCEGVSGLASAISMDGCAISTNGKVVCVSSPQEFWHRIRQDAFPPVMSYFEPQKRTLSGANLIDDQRKRWVELCAISQVIAVVGVHPRAHDRHIWGPLARSQAKIVYCGGEAGALAFKSWAKANGRSGKDHVLNGFFGDEFEALCKELDL